MIAKARQAARTKAQSWKKKSAVVADGEGWYLQVCSQQIIEDGRPRLCLVVGRRRTPWAPGEFICETHRKQRLD